MEEVCPAGCGLHHSDHEEAALERHICCCPTLGAVKVLYLFMHRDLAYVVAMMQDSSAVGGCQDAAKTDIVFEVSNNLR